MFNQPSESDLVRDSKKLFFIGILNNCIFSQTLIEILRYIVYLIILILINLFIHSTNI